MYTHSCRDHLDPDRALYSFDRDSKWGEVPGTTSDGLMTLPSPSYEGTPASQVLLGLIRATLIEMVKAVVLEGRHSVAHSHILLFKENT